MSLHLHQTESEAIRQAAADNRKPGLFSRWFGKGKNADRQPENGKAAAQLFVGLVEVPSGQKVVLLDQFGKPLTGQQAAKWLNSLYLELR